jgi:nitrate reductase molybdenum cofactor assembly chaperone NarJ/NarW
MTKSFKVISALLSYPSEELIMATPELLDVLANEGLLTEPRMKSVRRFVDDLHAHDIFDAQERYVLLFDRTRSLSLHLFEHVHGEGRDRGQAMVDLMQMYGEAGLEIDAKELPDYLPMFLEFLSLQQIDAARELLGEPLHIISGLKERLKKRKSPYTALLAALECIAKSTARAEDVKAFLSTPEDDPEDLAALDAVWEEEMITFGSGANGDAEDDEGCPQANQMLEQMMREPTKAASTDASNAQVRT